MLKNIVVALFFSAVMSIAGVANAQEPGDVNVTEYSVNADEIEVTWEINEGVDSGVTTVTVDWDENVIEHEGTQVDPTVFVDPETHVVPILIGIYVWLFDE